MEIIDPLRAIPKDKGWAWMCLLGGLLMNAVIPGAIWKTFGVLFLEVKAKYNASAAFLSWTSSMAMALALFMGAPANALSRRFCARYLVMSGGLLAMAGFTLSSIAGNQWVFFVTYGIGIGLGTGLAYSPSIVTVGQYFDKRRAFANGVSLAGSGIGSIAVPPIMVYAQERYGLEGTLIIMGAITLNLCVVGMLLRPAQFYIKHYCLKVERKRRMHSILNGADCKNKIGDVASTIEKETEKLGHANEGMQLEDSHSNNDSIVKTDESPKIIVSIIDTDGVSSTAADQHNRSSANTKHHGRQPMFDCRLLTTPILLIYAVSQGFAVSNYLVMFMTATPHAEQIGVSSTRAAMLVSIMGVADIVSRVGVGIIADLNIIKKQHMYHASMALSCVVFCVLPSLKTYFAMSVACVLFAIAGGGYFSLFPTLLADSLGIERLSTTYGMAVIFVGAGVLTVPACMGKLQDITGTWNASFYACGGMMASVTILNLFVPLATGGGHVSLKLN